MRLSKRLPLAVFVMLLGMLPALQPAAQAAAGKLPQVRIVVSASQAQVGDIVEAAVWLQGFTGSYADVQGYEIHLSFDPSLLQPVAASGEAAALTPGVFAAAAGPMTLANQIDAEAGEVRISQITTKKGSLLFAGYGKVGTIGFKALSAGDAKLNQTKSIVIKADNPGINMIHTVNSPVVRIGPAEEAAAAGPADTVEQVGEAPPKPGSSVSPEQAIQSFKDAATIQTLAWAKEEIGALAQAKVLQGNSAGYFEPRRNMTRAEFAKTAVVALGLDMKQQLTPTFADVAKPAWYYDYVETASHYGLIQGAAIAGGNAYRPNDPITRAEIAAVLARALRELEGGSAGEAEPALPFADVRTNDWAAADIRLLYGLKLLEGKTADRFAPSDNASRAEITVLLGRLLSYVNG